MSNEDALTLARRCATHMYDADLASRQLGIVIDVIAPGSVEATMTVRGDMLNGHKICHGGYLFTLADTAFAFACNAYDQVAVAAGASIEFVAPARAGERLCARAIEIHRGRRSGVYDVHVSDSNDRLIAVFRGRCAALEQPILR